MGSDMISVRQASVFPPAFFRFRRTMDTLVLSYILSAAGRIRNFHPLEHALTGRTTKSRSGSLRPLHFVEKAPVRVDRGLLGKRNNGFWGVIEPHRQTDRPAWIFAIRLTVVFQRGRICLAPGSWNPRC